MKKKSFLLKAAALLVFGICALIPAAAQQYPADTAFYPSVYGAFSELYPNARYLSIDFYNNTYTLTGITGRAGLLAISYDLTVKLNQNRQIEFSYNNIYQRDANNRWTRINAFGMYRYNNAINAIRTKMMEIANNSSLFERFERAAMADIIFVNEIMKDFTDLAFTDFINNYAKGSVFNITGHISEVSEYNRELNGTRYSYQVTLSVNLSSPSDAYLSGIAPNIRCRFYTNNDNVIRLSRNSELSVQGTLVGATRMTGGVSLQLVDSR
ncbi:MAG: hypothetical protein FWD14_02285 [Treponema sp.]|nr:hypothetical protein [Treponema sp.]